jgi:hypothetical protein
MTAIDVYPASPSVGVVADPKAVQRLVNVVLAGPPGGTGFEFSAPAMKRLHGWGGDCSVYGVESVLEQNNTRGVPQVEFMSGSFSLGAKKLFRIQEKDYHIFHSDLFIQGSVGVAIPSVEMVSVSVEGWPASITAEAESSRDSGMQGRRAVTDEPGVDQVLNSSLAWRTFVQEAMKESRPMDSWERKVAADFLWSEFE